MSNEHVWLRQRRRERRALHAIIKRLEHPELSGNAVRGAGTDTRTDPPTADGTRQSRHPAAGRSAEARPAGDGPATSNVVRALSAQLAALKKQHHDEITALNAALAAAHGKILDLRRRLGARQAQWNGRKPRHGGCEDQI